MTYEAKVKDWQKEEVEKFAELLDQYDIIGVINMKNLPARQLQNIRGQLRDTVMIRMTKKRLMTRALEKSEKDNIKDLEEYLKGMPALLFSNENPFKLFKILKENKSKAPIKGGQEAPHDIEIPEGPTSFPPGPIIGELGNMGIPAGVEEGKVAIQQDTVVAEEGEEVGDDLARIITRLGIEPMEVGLDLVAIWEEGEILTKDVLDVDVDEYVDNIKTAAGWAFNLSVEAGFPTKSNIPSLLMQGHGDALALAQSEGILTDETVMQVVANAVGAARSLQTSIDIEAHMGEVQEEPEEGKAEEEEPAEEDEAGEEEKEESEDEEPEDDVEDDEDQEEPEEEPEDDEGDEEEEKEIPSKSTVEDMTKDEIKEYADEEWDVELSTDDLKDEMIEQLFNEIG